ncbi:MAG: ParB N-terminal domain-containing protein [Acidobacteria bacterium]|nr:ParB N-terminal domain-containing protein [Acidobacteriota bacterium]
MHNEDTQQIPSIDEVDVTLPEDSCEVREEDSKADAAPVLDLTGQALGIRNVPIDEILEHEELRIRDGYDLKTIENLENKIRYERPDLPRIILFLFAGVYYVVDGVYRWLGYKRAGHTHIEAEVRVGTMREAILFRFRANASHGTR